jgi:hypothetical protein
LYEGELNFTLKKKSSKFLLEIVTLVSSASNIVSDTEFILREGNLYRSFLEGVEWTPGVVLMYW